LIFLVRRLGPHLPAIPRWSSPSLLPFPSLISSISMCLAFCPHDCSRVLPNLPVFPPCLLTSAVLILYAAPLYPLKKLRTVAPPTPPSPSFRGSPAPEVFQRPPPPATRLRTMAWPSLVPPGKAPRDHPPKATGGHCCPSCPADTEPNPQPGAVCLPPAPRRPKRSFPPSYLPSILFFS
jgi:hypothetical protein